MAGKSRYSDEDKARVYIALSANDGNVKRVARETGVPESTVRGFKKQFEQEPPRTELVEAVVSDFVEDAGRVRNKALLAIEKKIDSGDAKVGELNATVGILTDKIDRARGLVDRSVVEHMLPSADDIRATLGVFAEEARALSRQRQAEIVDSEVIEQPMLPIGK